MKIQLKSGDITPKIHSKDLWGKEINVPNQNQWFFLSFHRFATCPFCNLRTNELIRNYPKFQEKNIEIISIWPSKKELLLEHSSPTPSVFPILSDEKKHIYKAFGVTESSLIGGLKMILHPTMIWQALSNNPKKPAIDSDPMQMPASFLIDPKGIIRLAYYGAHYGDHPSIDRILSIPNSVI
ncbi:redoxin domain-containing protein [Algoriphagus halophytocola]|uniref:Redoxin domain-containing protein n=1 Tax=Algoriphagus halophytocola TaxID=2991499 RepID=A0ABY6MK52_9BACT|nr:redoxin domain-containing protein [Algoriphagus sp. TR-M5]UZD22792.1 redoxin domain-containing protein [Algoriphagus sp. TR-M5]